MGALKKVTVLLPERLIRRAQRSTGAGITPTIRRGLELLAASQAYEGLRRLRGKVAFSLDLADLRRDRT